MSSITPIPAPKIHIPPSSSTVSLSIINTTTSIVSATAAFVKPAIPGHEYANLPTFAFLIHHGPSGNKALFDLGARKDWWNLSPTNVNYVMKNLPGLSIERGIDEVLKDGEIDVRKGDVKTVIWSHFHWDHIGDVSLFPEETEVTVGPGFKESFMPGYPTKGDAALLETDLDGLEIKEVEFDKSFEIGGLPAHDFFGDGSFYLLDTPGHCPGHISALARTTADSFVFLGGDICHVPGAWRPTQHLPLPDPIPASVPLDARLASPCPCSTFTGCHPDQSAPRTTPYYNLTDAPGSLYTFPEVAQESLERMKIFDANPNILICVAHDSGLLPVLDFFPNGTLNGWKAKGYKEATAWGFLNEMPVDGNPGRALLVPGLIKGGQNIRPAEEVL